MRKEKVFERQKLKNLRANLKQLPLDAFHPKFNTDTKF